MAKKTKTRDLTSTVTVVVAESVLYELEDGLNRAAGIIRAANALLLKMRYGELTDEGADEDVERDVAAYTAELVSDGLQAQAGRLADLSRVALDARMGKTAAAA